MYKQPQIEEGYKEQWLRAERELALRWFVGDTQLNDIDSATPDNASGERFSRNDFLKALKRVSRKSKPSPKLSKT